jgi:hypothetical protein
VNQVASRGVTLAEILDIIGNRRETRDSKSVPVGSLVGENELSLPIVSPAGSLISPTSEAAGIEFLSSVSLVFPI